LREAVAENLSERLSALELNCEVKRRTKTRPAKAEKKAKQLEQANQAQQDRVLLASCTGRRCGQQRFTGQD